MSTPAPFSMKIHAAAEYTGIAASTLRDLAAAGTIPARKAGREYVFLRSDLEEYVRALPHATSQEGQ